MRSTARNIAYDGTERIGSRRLVVTRTKHLKDLSLVRVKLVKRHLSDRTGEAVCECSEKRQHGFAFVGHGFPRHLRLNRKDK